MLTVINHQKHLIKRDSQQIRNRGKTINKISQINKEKDICLEEVIVRVCFMIRPNNVHKMNHSLKQIHPPRTL